MDVNVLFLLLFPLIYIGYGTHQTNNGYKNQTWNEASNDSTCSLIGLNLTGEMEENLHSISSSIFSGTSDMVWIGAYAKRAWINFEGCNYGKFKNNYSSMALMSNEDPAKSCLRHCNFNKFVLAEDKCVCYKHVASLDSGCTAKKCFTTKYMYCGKGTAPSDISFHCMCRFSMEVNRSYKFNESDCLAVSYIPPQHYSAIDCRSTYKPLCYDPNTHAVDLSRGPNEWQQSWSQCFDNNKEFAGKTINVTGLYNGTYWVGTFAVVYKEWGRPGSADYSCIAVSIDRTNNNLTTVVLPCDTLLPALCSYPSLSTYSPTQTTVNVVSTDGVNILTGGQKTDSVSVIVGSVVGSVVLITLITTVVLFLRHRVTFRKNSSGTGLGHSQVEEQIQSPVIHSEGIEMNDDTLTVNDSVNVYENMEIRDTTETTDRGGNTDKHRYSERGITSSKIYSNDAAIYQPKLFAEEKPGSHYYGLSQPSHDEHKYGQLM